MLNRKYVLAIKLLVAFTLIYVVIGFVFGWYLVYGRYTSYLFKPWVNSTRYYPGVLNLKMTPLIYAVMQEDTEATTRLLRIGADISKPAVSGMTALHWAAINGNTEIAHILLDCGANPSARGVEGWTPLHYAAKYGYVEIAALLISNGANWHERDKKNNTPRMVAEAAGKLNFITEIEEYIAENQNDKPGQSK